MKDTLAAPPRENRPVTGIAVNGVAYFLISVSDLIGKISVAVVPVAQLLTIRSVFGLVFMVPLFLIARRQGKPILQTRRLPLHAVRAIVMFISVFTFFEALRFMDLAKITAIMFTMPIFVALFSGVALGERVAPQQWAAILVGFLGTAILLDLGDARFERADGLSLVSAITWAISLILLRRLSATESPVTVIAWSNTFLLPVYAVLAAFDFKTINTSDLGMIVVMSAVHVYSQVLGVHAYRLANAATVAPVQYTQLLWASIFGWAIWNQVPRQSVIIGAGLIVTAGLILLYAEHRREKFA